MNGLSRIATSHDVIAAPQLGDMAVVIPNPCPGNGSKQRRFVARFGRTIDMNTLRSRHVLFVEERTSCRRHSVVIGLMFPEMPLISVLVGTWWVFGVQSIWRGAV